MAVRAASCRPALALSLRASSWALAADTAATSPNLWAALHLRARSHAPFGTERLVLRWALEAGLLNHLCNWARQQQQTFLRKSCG